MHPDIKGEMAIGIPMPRTFPVKEKKRWHHKRLVKRFMSIEEEDEVLLRMQRSFSRSRNTWSWFHQKEEDEEETWHDAGREVCIQSAKRAQQWNQRKEQVIQIERSVTRGNNNKNNNKKKGFSTEDQIESMKGNRLVFFSLQVPRI